MQSFLLCVLTIVLSVARYSPHAWLSPALASAAAKPVIVDPLLIKGSTIASKTDPVRQKSRASYGYRIPLCVTVYKIISLKECVGLCAAEIHIYKKK
jgi:hypothetical protein